MLMIFFVVVLVPAVVVYLCLNQSKHTIPCLTVGDVIVYKKQKASIHPGMRAYSIKASKQGDLYTYFVDKYWAVADIIGNGQIVAVTRTNKQHYITPGDPNIRKANLIDNLRFCERCQELRDILKRE